MVSRYKTRAGEGIVIICILKEAQHKRLRIKSKGTWGWILWKIIMWPIGPCSSMSSWIFRTSHGAWSLSIIKIPYSIHPKTLKFNFCRGAVPSDTTREPGTCFFYCTLEIWWIDTKKMMGFGKSISGFKCLLGGYQFVRFPGCEWSSNTPHLKKSNSPRHKFWTMKSALAYDNNQPKQPYMFLSVGSVQSKQHPLSSWAGWALSSQNPMRHGNWNQIKSNDFWDSLQYIEIWSNKYN